MTGLPDVAARSAIPLRGVPQPIASASTPNEAAVLRCSLAPVAGPRSHSIESAIPAAAAACLQALLRTPLSGLRTAAEMNTDPTQYGACSGPTDALFPPHERGASAATIHPTCRIGAGPLPAPVV